MNQDQSQSQAPADIAAFEGGTKAPPAVTSALLYLDGVSVSFDGYRAIRNLSLVIEPGEMRAIIGPNGAGKTTMMDIVTGKTRPDEGDVLFDSGKTALKENAKKSLDKVAAILKEKYAVKYIRVAGFTDTDPIKKSGFKDNYYLGFDRAYSVREYIIKKGLEGNVISLSSFGPDVPLKTKAQSRRVEVIVVSN